MTVRVKVTADLLVRAMGCTPERAERFAPHLDLACQTYQIDSPKRLAAFLAQIGHESGALRYTQELWGPTSAQARYEGRRDLGNTEPGDGKRFMGRGLIQTTGRGNYRALTQRLRARFGSAPDFEQHPEKLEEPGWAAISAADYWDWRSLNALADAGDFERITRRINGGLNGQEDRLARWARATRVLEVQDPTPQTKPKEQDMPAPFVAAALPAIINAVPALLEIFKGDSKVSERNVKAAEVVVGIAQDALGTRNAQETAEVLASGDAEAVQKVQKAVQERWFDIKMAEAGGGGIEGARKADAAMVDREGPGWQVLRSPSFIVALFLLPLVYMIIGAVVGLFGTPFPDDVRSAIANGIVGMIIGGLIGYYYGQTTSRNRA